MRGDGDGIDIKQSTSKQSLSHLTEPITGSAPITLLEKITADQKQILMNVLNVTNSTISEVEQVWALCKLCFRNSGACHRFSLDR
jgi:hypothetical protein